MNYSDTQIWIIIIALGIGTYLIRFSFLGLIGDRDLPDWALRHLRYNKHEVVLFHTLDGAHELDFDFDDRPRKYTDVETGEQIQLFASQIKEKYKERMQAYFTELKYKSMQYNIDYVPVDIGEGFDQVLMTYLMRRNKFV